MVVLPIHTVSSRKLIIPCLGGGVHKGEGTAATALRIPQMRTSQSRSEMGSKTLSWSRVSPCSGAGKSGWRRGRYCVVRKEGLGCGIRNCLFVRSSQLFRRAVCQAAPEHSLLHSPRMPGAACSIYTLWAYSPNEYDLVTR